MKYGVEKYCPVCSSKGLKFFFRTNSVPIYCNVLYESKEEAIKAPLGDIDLGFCKSCGFIYNYAFNPNLLIYTEEYDNSLHFSSRFQEYARTLAANLIQKYQIEHKTIVELGCGKGDFLKIMCETGNNSGYGFDPSYQREREIDVENLDIIFFKDYYSEKHKIKGDFLYSRHVLEHINSPINFLNLLQGAAKTNDSVFFLEVPNFMFTLSGGGIWDIIYEHCSYFTPISLFNLLVTTGLSPIALYDTFDGQYLCIEAGSKERYDKIHLNASELMENVSHAVNAIGKKLIDNQNYWRENLEKISKNDQTCVIWGAGSKGVTFLNTFNDINSIKYAVDINPHKIGKYFPMSGQKVVHPGFLEHYKPDVVIIMNSIYFSEISNDLREMHISPELICI